MAPQSASVIMAAVLGIAFVAPAAAQDGTPTSSAQSTAACDAVEPRDAEFFSSLAESPQATPSSQGQATPEPFAMPEGDVADDETIAQIEALYQTLVACLNAGDYLRAYALYTEAYLLRNLSEEILTRLEATPVPVQASTQSAFGGVLDARVLDDDRIAALVTTTNPLSGDIVLFALLTEEGGELRIDDETVVEAETAATPSA